MPIEILRPSAWDSGWPTGFVSNIDEPLSAPDGSTIETTIANDQCLIDFTNPTVVRDIDTVTSVVAKVRARGWDDPGALPTQLFCAVRISGVWRSWVPLLVNDTFATKSYNHPDWNVDWTVTQLDTIQLEFTPSVGTDFMAIDTIELEIHYDVPPPIEADPGIYAAVISGQTPTAFYEQFARPAIDTRSLATGTPALKQDDTQRPDPDVLILNTSVLVLLEKFTRSPPSSTVTMAGQVPSLIDDIVSSEGTVALAGKVPTFSVSENVFILVPTDERTNLVLSLATHDVGVDDFARIPSPEVLTLVGQIPTATVTDNYIALPGAGSLTYSLSTPIANRGANFLVGEEILSLTGYPVSQVLPVPVGSMTFAGQLPALFTEFTVLEIEGQVPVLGTNIPVSADSLVLASYVPLVENATSIVPEGSLTLSTGTPTLSYASVLIAGDSGLISLTTRYDVEHVATPTDEVEF